MTQALLKPLPVALIAILLAASPAAAQQCNAPPGTAAVDEYCESVPSVTGNGGGGSRDSSAAKPAASTVNLLQRSGKSGQELNRFLGQDVAAARGGGQSATRAGSKGASGQQSGPSESADKAPQEPSSNPLGAVQSAVSSGATVGTGFVWVLVAIAVLMAGIAWMRYRRSSS